MISQSIAVLCLAATCLAQSNQYLPPDKGYSYEPPSVPFPSGPGPAISRPPPPPSVSPPAPSPSLPVGPPSPSLPPPSPSAPYPPPGKPVGDYGPDSHLNMPHVPGMPYEFDYAVNDPAHMAYYSHNANSDGDQIKGEYRVQLPDGRTQIVTYVADWATGFHADVKYEGEASYPPPGSYNPPVTFPGAGAPARPSGPAPYPASSGPGPAQAPAPGSFPSPPSGPASFEGYPAGGPPDGSTGSGY